jgi:hypothetical protein
MGNLLEIGATDPGRLTARLLPCFIYAPRGWLPISGILTSRLGSERRHGTNALCIFVRRGIAFRIS